MGNGPWNFGCRGGHSDPRSSALKRTPRTLSPCRPWLAIGILSLALGCGDDTAKGADTDSGTDGSTANESSATDPSGSTTDTETGGESGDTDDTPEGFVPPPGGMRKLTGREYRSSVGLILGNAAEDAADPPRDIAQGGFDAVGASILALPADVIENYERSAAAIADAVIAEPSHLQALVPCVDAGATAACYREVATTIGRFAYRRTLTPD